MKPEIKKLAQTILQAPIQNDLQKGDEATKKIIDIKLQDVNRQIQYDTEENCERDNCGNWGERLSSSV